MLLVKRYNNRWFETVRKDAIRQREVDDSGYGHDKSIEAVFQKMSQDSVKITGYALDEEIIE